MYGFQIDSHTQESFPNVDYAEIAIFNVPEYEGTDNVATTADCKIRDAFYRLYFDDLPKVADLGTISMMPTRKESFELITEVCTDLIDNYFQLQFLVDSIFSCLKFHGKQKLGGR